MPEPPTSAVKSILDLAKACSYAIAVVFVALLSNVILLGPYDFDRGSQHPDVRRNEL